MSRFVKGMSGNPRGRPRKAKPVQASAFDIIFDRRITVVQNGAPRDLSIEEGLQLKTYQSALAGNKPARRAVLKMIAKREQWLASRRASHAKVTMRREHAMRNADKALLILGIITPDERFWSKNGNERYVMEKWAVEAAIKRMRPRSMARRYLDSCGMFTRDAATIAWPDASD
ncbi:MAG: hypothetical protein IT553_05080 [Sphingomonadaceae bacterium]|nr:hypothetical protein [Sphingomonadaceae bacterium]